MSLLHLSKRQQMGLDKVGDILIPGSETLPKFSTLDLGPELHRLLLFIPAEDQKNFLRLMHFLSFLPSFLVSSFLAILTLLQGFPHPIGSTCRLANIGIKGVVYSLYYSDLSIEKKIRWEFCPTTKEF